MKLFFFMFEFTNSARQTETIREHEHLRYIPMVLLAPVPFSVCGLSGFLSSAGSRARVILIQNLPRLNCT